MSSVGKKPQSSVGKQTGSVDLIKENQPAEFSLDKLRNQFSQLSRNLPDQVRHAAIFALNQPQDIAFCTIREFSERAKVSPASALRMARVFGFKGYSEFRNAFRELLKSTPGSVALMSTNNRPADALLSCFCSVPDDELPSFNVSLNAVADCILSANTVFVVGFRSAHSFAQYFTYHAHIIMPSFRLASPAMSSAADHLASAGPDDLVIVFSMAPYATEAVQLAIFLADQNIPTIAITDDAESPFASRCTHVLQTKRFQVGNIQSMAGCVTMSEALLSLCFEKMGSSARQKTRDFEHRVRRMRGYWPSN